MTPNEKRGWQASKGWAGNVLAGPINFLDPNIATGTDTLKDATGFILCAGGPTLTSDPTEHYEGTRSFKATFNNRWDAFRIDPGNLISGETYELKFYYKSIDNPLMGMVKKISDDTWIKNISIPLSEDWTPITSSITIPEGETGIRIVIQLQVAGTAVLWWDKASLHI